MEAELLTTREAARVLGVGTTSIKRWADAGMLPCVKTPGGHRRYPRTAVEALLGKPVDEDPLPDPAGTAPGHEAPTDQWTEAWVNRLVRGRRADEVLTALLAEREARGSWWQVADRLAAVLAEIGRRWSTGQLSVLQEHLASERLARGIARVVETQELPDDAPRALLLVAPGDDHTLGLSLAELCLREAGWHTQWAGRRTPIDAVNRFVHDEQVHLVAVSASEISTDEVALRALAAHLGEVCRRKGALLILGGAGAWPDPPPYGRRMTSFQSLPPATELATADVSPSALP